MVQIKIREFRHADRPSVQVILHDIGWAEHYVEGQLASIQKLIQDDTGQVFVAEGFGKLVGFIQVQHHKWNRLSFIHGLCVSIHSRKQGIASALVSYAENESQKRCNRGIHVDTPVDNTGGRAFYEAIGFDQAYIMPEYYDEGLDGVTYLRLFKV